VKLWCLGNEMDGPWQIGHKDADEYGKLAAEAGKAMRLVDPSIELVACGSSSMMMDTFGAWEQTVLGHTWDVVDHVSMHAYYEELDGDRASFLGSGTSMDRFIRRVVASADAVAARRRSDKVITISFDEWNVWYLQSRFVGEKNLPLQRDAPRIIEDVYSALDAVVVGDLLVTLLNHADRIPVACLAQLVNVIAPIMTEPGGRAWRQTIFHPFAQAAGLARGRVLRLLVDSPLHPTERFGEVPTLHATATWDEDTGDLCLFAVNRSTTDPLPLTADVRGFGALQVAEHSLLADDDLQARNTLEHPDRVVPRSGTGARLQDGQLTVGLPPASWNVFRLSPLAAG
jgi:alpha-N-arabinofuranosidase